MTEEVLGTLHVLLKTNNHRSGASLTIRGCGVKKIKSSTFSAMWARTLSFTPMQITKKSTKGRTRVQTDEGAGSSKVSDMYHDCLSFPPCSLRSSGRPNVVV